MKAKPWLLSLLLVIPLFLQTGCAVLVVGGAAAAGAGTYAYVTGEAKTMESASIEEVWAASQAALKELEYPIITEQKDALEACLTARNAADKKIAIKLKKISDSTTEIRIRVGTFGNESLSRAILDKIQERV